MSSAPNDGGAGAAELTPEQLAKKERKRLEREAKNAEKKAKWEAKQKAKAEAAAAQKAAGGAGKGKKEKKEKELRLRTEFVNTTPVGEKKDMSDEMAAAYDPAAVEAAWYSWWEKKGYFTPAAERPPSGEQGKFVMVIPPPNVTGALHLGHALTNAVQDTLVRWRRMHGDDVLWVPGCDHAGIATQRVVEKALAKEGVTRRDLGREKFVERVFEWKDKYGNRIYEQLRRIGSSLDWTRTRFTMDEMLSKAVVEAFVRLFDDGLLFRANRLVNYCCALETAISDIEVDHIDIEKPTALKVPGHAKPVMFGQLTSFAYKLASGDGEIVVATTRPETMLGDVAVAVHPDDERYRALVGQRLVHPFNGREIPVIADGELVKMEFGTGAVKITPAHDANDYECGKRHQLECVSMLTPDGRVNEQGGEQFRGMLRFEAREAVIAALKERGLFRGQEPNVMRIGLCSRTKDVIEPMLCPQWYVRMDDMSRRAADAVRDGELELVPKSHEKTWFHFLDAGMDWCISRQLWWGHRIPVYQYRAKGGTGEFDEEHWMAGRTEADARERAAAKLGVPAAEVELRQDDDVLDTWFSSALFPFSVFGWPDETPDLARFYPNSVLETGHDILFFWVAKMVIFAQQLTGQLPFRRVLLHAMVRDAHNRKMSKSLGNVVDPVWVVEGITLEDLQRSLLDGNLPEHEIKKAQAGQKLDYPKGIPECGTDALRFGLCSYMSQGRSINMNVNKMVAYRHFCNKLWNAIRFAMANLGGEFAPAAAVETAPALPEERWLLSRLHAAIGEVERGLADFNLGDSVQALTVFWKEELCDVFLEVIKPHMRAAEEAGAPAEALARRDSIRQTLYTALESGLRLLHPFMPFLTEELWQRLPRRPAASSPPESIMVAQYPTQAELAAAQSDAVERDVTLALRGVVGVLRSLRAEYRLTRQRPTVTLSCETAEVVERLRPYAASIATLGQVSEPVALVVGGELPAGAVRVQVDASCEVFFTVRGFVDIDAELARFGKLLAKAEQDAARLAKLRSAGKVDKMPAEVAAQHAEKEDAAAKNIDALKATIENLGKLKE